MPNSYTEYDDLKDCIRNFLTLNCEADVVTIEYEDGTTEAATIRKIYERLGPGYKKVVGFTIVGKPSLATWNWLIKLSEALGLAGHPNDAAAEFKSS